MFHSLLPRSDSIGQHADKAMWWKYMQASSPMIAQTVLEIGFKVVGTTNPNKWSESIDRFRLRLANLSGNSSLKVRNPFCAICWSFIVPSQHFSHYWKLKYKQTERVSLLRIISGTPRGRGGYESPLNDDLFRKDWEKLSRVNTGRGDGSSNGMDPFSLPGAHRDNAHSRNIKQTGFLLMPICWDNKWIFGWHVTIYRFTFRLLILDIQFFFLPSRRVFGRRDRHKCP